MKIEILGFFLKEVVGDHFDEFSGSMKIFLPEKKMQILGIKVKKKKDKWFFMMPGVKGFHHDSGKKIGFPFVSFSDDNEKKVFFHNLKEFAIEYIIDKIKNNTLKLPVEYESGLVKSSRKPRVTKKVQTAVHQKRSVITKTDSANS